MIEALSGDDVVILNPRRPDWNPKWRPDADEPEFRRQVEWELGALESADVIVLYFSPGSQSPISLLEMGLHARSGKLIVLCPPDIGARAMSISPAPVTGSSRCQTCPTCWPP
jgi:hypothetical protein